MRVCAIQPPYGHDRAMAEKTVDFIIRELDHCDPAADLILTPEYSNTPGTLSPEEALPFAHACRERLENAAIRAAKRCNAIVALSYCAAAEGKERNMTRLFLPSGKIAGEYYKQQLVLKEPSAHGVDNSYALQPRTPTIVEVNGIRFGFVICYDAYYEEYIAAVASCRPDIILVSAMQRAEQSEILRLLNRMLAFHTNAFVVRASYSMGENSAVGGTSLVADPSGKILADMGSRTGSLLCEIGDPKWKYMRSNSFGGHMIRNDQFIEQGRTPWAYRPCGPFIRLDNRRMPYPRVCAHRGFHMQLPENTMPAFGAAVAMGADEIEFDLWETRDGVPVSIHDPSLERVSDGTGIVREKNYAELLELDFGKEADPSLKGLRIATLEEILKQFTRQTVMNIHIKSLEGEHFSRDFIRKIAGMLQDYDCTDYCYFMGTPEVFEAALEAAPEIPRFMGADFDMEKMQIIDRALRYQCSGVQFFKPHFNPAMIDRAHRAGLRCNLFWSDEPEEALEYFAMGIDTILTNNYWQVRRAREQFLSKDEVISKALFPKEAGTLNCACNGK